MPSNLPKITTPQPPFRATSGCQNSPSPAKKTTTQSLQPSPRTHSTPAATTRRPESQLFHPPNSPNQQLAWHTAKIPTPGKNRSIKMTCMTHRAAAHRCKAPRPLASIRLCRVGGWVGVLLRARAAKAASALKPKGGVERKFKCHVNRAHLPPMAPGRIEVCWRL